MQQAGFIDHWWEEGRGTQLVEARQRRARWRWWRWRRDGRKGGGAGVLLLTAHLQAGSGAGGRELQSLLRNTWGRRVLSLSTEPPILNAKNMSWTYPSLQWADSGKKSLKTSFVSRKVTEFPRWCWEPRSGVMWQQWSGERGGTGAAAQGEVLSHWVSPMVICGGFIALL